MYSKKFSIGTFVILAVYLVFLGLVVGVRSLTSPAGNTQANTVRTGVDSGFGGEIKAVLTMDADGTILDVVLEGSDETPAIGGKALETLREQILSAQSADIDGVSGATLTSTGVKNAVAKALSE